MDVSQNFAKLCRTCLLEMNDMNSIFSQNIIHMITVCTNIEINKCDGLPDQICSKCFEDVKTSYNFKIQSKRCNEFLHKINNEKDHTRNIKISKNKVENIAGQNENVNILPALPVNENEQNKSIEHDLIGARDRRASPINSNSETKHNVDDTQNTNDWSCKVCGKKLFYRSVLMRHMNSHPEYRTKRFFCSVCQKGFCEKRNLSKHMQRHKGETKYDCNYCGKGFYEIGEIAYHVKKQHDARPIECKICQKQFILDIQLDLHMKNIHVEKKYICKTCGKELRSSKALFGHNLTHNTDPFPCDQCDKWFKYESNLKEHIKACHLGLKKKHICTVCGKEIKDLKHHMVLKHATDHPYKCTNCDKAYAEEWALKQHFKVHTGELNVYRELCPFCGKKMHTTTALRIHMRTHTGERPFKCTTCTKAFMVKAKLLEHQRVHTGERTHRCLTCSKMFTTKECLKKHQVVHTGARPYLCKICGRGFGQKSTLTTHMKIH